jgi:hypothetical protein
LCTRTVGAAPDPSRRIRTQGNTLLPPITRYSVTEYDRSMRRKTSVTLSEEIVKQLDRASRKGESRSGTIERILRDALSAEARRAANSRDLALINDNADALNAEAEDVLGYQADL